MAAKTNMIFVRPGEGHESVPMNDGRTVTSEGLDVEKTLFVRRRLKDGDLVEARRPAAKKGEGDK